MSPLMKEVCTRTRLMLVEHLALRREVEVWHFPVCIDPLVKFVNSVTSVYAKLACPCVARFDEDAEVCIFRLPHLHAG